ncbi:NUDIX domain-containing protein [Kitasatospora sp. NPDC088783]|uniref:NUDIX hydrolase n=1 Tax=Kitasatospora sp. NPDC088783 TaxID=3364077 RepID=UPI0038121E21
MNPFSDTSVRHASPDADALATPVSDPVTLAVGVHLVLTDAEGRVLLGRRRNTSYADNLWHTPAGHLLPRESITAGMAREAMEELGITIAEADLDLLHTLHHFDADDGRSRVQLFFGTSHYDGALRNAEPHKCSQLKWWPTDSLPADTVLYTAHALAEIARDSRLSVVGWPSTAT